MDPQAGFSGLLPPEQFAYFSKNLLNSLFSDLETGGPQLFPEIWVNGISGFFFFTSLPLFKTVLF